MKFIDSVNIGAHAGHGGPGIISFARAKGLPNLGPDGGDGGDGGSVYLVGTPRVNTFSNLNQNRIYKAKAGQTGGTNGKTGARGADTIIEVPLGTLVYENSEYKTLLGEITQEDEKLLVAKGGNHGWGNIRYKSSVTRAPYKSSPGLPGEEIDLNLELSLLADIGLAGFPNAGKSSFLRVISKAKPKTADYPFTTIHPQLGVVDDRDIGGTSFVIADIPGLIEGASQGLGLGHQFLKHLKRTKYLAFFVDEFSGLIETSAVEQVEILRKELKNFSQELFDKGFCIIVNKTDLCSPEQAEELMTCLLYTSPSPRDRTRSRMPSSA